MSEARRRRVVDGAVFGLYEDDEPEHRPPLLALAVLAATTVVVAGLVWRATNTDAALELPPDEVAATTTTVRASEAVPTVEELRLLLPPGIGDCAPPPDAPSDGPERAVLRCAGPGVPESVDFSLYASVEARDEAFDFVAALLEIPTAGSECAVGRPGRHDYVGVEQVGQLACQSVAGRTDLLWTSDVGPLLAIATGEGSYAEQYRWWSDLVERTDAAFPTGEELALLDQLPDSLLDDCDRDPDGRLLAGGDVAVTCRPERSPAAEVTWIRFPDDEAMAGWFAGRRERLSDAVVADGDDACAATPFDLGGRTGTVLCHPDSGGRAVVAWTRDTDLIGSVAEGADGVAIADLLAWWRRGGHLP